ncbi:hypothetical protein RhiJN_06454 [Ceratobasidium sp. AG-Ba]|nr:hypothetical protein RhiJN_06454 [Ceratobasidium sp. AG-Ba]
MPRHTAQNEDLDMTYIKKLPYGKGLYICTLCASMREPQSLANMRKHISQKGHMNRVSYQDLRNLDSKPPGPVVSEGSAMSLNALDDLLVDAMEWPIDSHLDEGDDEHGDLISEAFESSFPLPPLPPPPPPARPEAPEYNFFEDLIYQDFDEDTLPGTFNTEFSNHPAPTLAAPVAPVATNASSASAAGSKSGPTTARLPSKLPQYPTPIDTFWEPFPDKAHFLTYSLFHTAHVRFSRAQQEAILDWAREMGTSQVPTMHSLNSCQEELKTISGIGPRQTNHRQEELWARGHRVYAIEHLGVSTYHVLPETAECSLSVFSKSCVELSNQYPNGLSIRSENKVYTLAPHELREKARGRPVHSVPFVVFVDDVSGNVSKQWNKHWCCYVSNASLPRTEMNKRANIRFMCTTQHTSPLEMMQGVCETFGELFNDLVTVYDTELECEVLVRPYILVLTGDNPMQATECSCTGMKSNRFCRTCHVGGTTKYKTTDDGYAAFFTSGPLRRATETIGCINEQFELAFTTKNADSITALQRETGIKDSIAQPLLDKIIKQRRVFQKAGHSMAEIPGLLRAYFVGLGRIPKMNPLLHLPGFDVHIDTPTETLHTILLGIVKYLWGQSVFVMEKKKQFDTFSVRLRSIFVDGLSSHPVPNYIFTNQGSLNGKHLKLLVQTVPFCLYDLVSQDLYHSWRTIGRLTVLVWYSTIHDMGAYLIELQAAIDDFLHTLARCSPRLVSDKAKVHLLVHMPLFAARYGPLIGCNTERYESFNSSFRQCSILSNRHAPSLDIAKSFHMFDQTKHIALGGYYYNPVSKKFLQAGKGVLELGKYSRFVRRILGVEKKASNTLPGSTTVRQNAAQITWSTSGSQHAPCPAYIEPDCAIRAAAHYTTLNGEQIAPGSFIVYLSSGPDQHPLLGRVHEILVPDSDQPACVTLYPFVWGDIDQHLYLPTVQREVQLCTTSVSLLVGKVNLQHRCAHSLCTPQATQFMRQERQLSGVAVSMMDHKNDIDFFVNVFSLHNYELINALVEYHLPGYMRMCVQAASDHEQIRLWAAKETRKPKKPEMHENEAESNTNPQESQPVPAAGAKTGRKGKSAAQSRSKSKGKEKMSTNLDREATQGGSNLPVMEAMAGPSAADTEGDNNELPPGWHVYWNYEYNAHIFYNTVTGEQTWDDPRLF